MEIVCRDGSLAYRQGVADGAPEAVQVSDRFHVWQGLSRRVEENAATHRGCLPEVLPAFGATESEFANAAATEPEPADTPAARHARRLFEAVHALTDTGRSYSSAARALGLDRRTVRKYARARTWHEAVRRPPRRPSTLDPYFDYLQQRWGREGEHSARNPHRELLTKGCLGHCQRVKTAVAPLRCDLSLDESPARPAHRATSDTLTAGGLASLTGAAAALREDQHTVTRGSPPSTTRGPTKAVSPT
ncbi:transposase [Streptomyces aurantiacus]|uniref:transposase n=1 Tax=Streptomyces aurantiacus TaxID=47760 RepID=UPI000A6D72D4|nr:transposase [Streptomyces aurantiacus]